MFLGFRKSADRPPTDSVFVQITCQSGVLTIAPTGPTLAECEATIIASEVRPVLADYSRKLRAVVIDLSMIQIMTSYGLGWCIEVRNAARMLNIPTVLYRPNLELHELFTLMKVDTLYRIAATPDDLANALAGRTT